MSRCLPFVMSESYIKSRCKEFRYELCLLRRDGVNVFWTFNFEVISFTFQYVDMVLLFMPDCGQLVFAHVDPPHQNSIIFATKKKGVFIKCR